MGTEPLNEKPGSEPVKEKPGTDVVSVEQQAPPDSEADDNLNKRETWSRKIDFLLALIGFSVGLGNVWRFPYLCYKNGGGAFLVPYLICVLVGGVPVLYLEVALGQYMQVGGLGVWAIAPLFKGIGFATTIIIALVNIYYNIILTWSFYYLFSSFTTQLPWVTCTNWWNTDDCLMLGDRNATAGGMRNLSKAIDPVTEFWERRVLAISDGIEQTGTVKWDLALCLVFAWVVIYLCIWKGIKSSGKVMYVTATSPYLLMLILLIRGCLLPGALDGIKFYLIPDWSKLLDTQVWVDAGTQIFFSYSISLGTLIALGSYNDFNHDSYKHSIMFACVNSGTSIFAGFLIFTILGFMAQEQSALTGLNITVAEVAESGPGLAFVAYPKAVAQMPIAPLWSILFFIMIILLGLDSQFVGVEGFVTAIVDEFPHYLRKGHRKELFILCVCIFSCIVGLSMVTNGGMYVFQIFDYYAGSRIILLVAFFECITVAWIYGAGRFYDNIESMLGYRINPFMHYSWKFSAPLFTLIVFVLCIVTYSELTIEFTTHTYTYPQWAVGLGWTMACVPIFMVPIVAVYKLVTTPGTFRERITILTTPVLRPHQLKYLEKPPGGQISAITSSAPGMPQGQVNMAYVSTLDDEAKKELYSQKSPIWHVTCV